MKKETCEKIVKFAFENGWRKAAEGWVAITCKESKPLTERQKQLLGVQDEDRVAFGGRIPVFKEGEIFVAESATEYERGWGYVGHNCTLYAIPTPAGWRLIAWCGNSNFACDLGRKTRAAFKSGDLSSLPLIPNEIFEEEEE